ncbi:carotenoid oxygenase family protein [Paenibacillus validus]|uniref:carotenoid oxygenase family protein n=1 Tax=Paenibacillus TaxID=44249 RepID=UPI000FDC10F3|nr:carotenoid oxygenase family protein [Paenibacillus validus]MED4602425.1 carotenoid oxygenase family protein [Paenibacillus validus]MED4606692.1 carotenoid oxygenase family protein [Paenibacillus validus]
MNKFPDLPIYTGFNTPSRMEVDIYDVEVDGDIPADINGAFYRVGPDPQYPPLLGHDIYFNGDGMVSMFRFQNGRVDYKSRYVRTDKFKLERKAQRALFGAYRNPFFDDPSVQGQIRGTANTNIVFHAGKLLALKEDSPPIVMDPFTLKSQGYYDYEGKMTSETFTAHPKLDPQTGEMIAFGYASKGIDTDDITYYVISPKGEIVHEVWFKMPYAAMQHDFGVTRDYVIFPVVPIVSSLERAREGKPTFGWDGTKDIYLGVIPRRGEARDIRWFKGPNQFASHVMNAFNVGSKIHIDMPVAEGNMFPFFPDIHGAAFDREKADSRVTRWTIDFESGNNTFEHKQLGNMIGDFPRIDDRYAMESYRHGFMCVTDLSKPYDSKRGGSISGMFINCLGHIDFSTGKEKIFFAGPTSTIQESTFIPKSDHAPEGEGYLIALVNRHEEMRSDLVILDAQHIDDGPIATVRLPLRLRQGLHGNWVPDSQLNTAKATV